MTTAMYVRSCMLHAHLVYVHVREAQLGYIHTIAIKCMSECQVQACTLSHSVHCAHK